MTPTKHPLCNDVLTKPAGMTEEECGDLPIRRDGDFIWSFWKPQPEELLALNLGGHVALAIMGATHPPLSVQATRPQGEVTRSVNESEYRHRMEAMNGRMIALIRLTKKIVSAWTGKRDNEREKLADEFLDMLTANRADGSLVETVPADDAEAWKAEAERWRKAAEDMRAATAVSPDEWAMKTQLDQISDALGDEWNVMPFAAAIGIIRNRLAIAERNAKAERERREHADAVIAAALHALDPQHPSP